MSRLPLRTQGYGPVNRDGSFRVAKNGRWRAAKPAATSLHPSRDGRRPQGRFGNSAFATGTAGRPRLCQLSQQSRSTPRIVRTRLRGMSPYGQLADRGLCPSVRDIEGVRAVPSSSAQPLHGAFRDDGSHDDRSRARRSQPVLPLPPNRLIQRHQEHWLAEASLIPHNSAASPRQARRTLRSFGKTAT